MRLLFFLIPCLLSAASSRIQFEPNHGQTDARVRYLARTPQGMVFFTGASIVFSRPEAAPITFDLAGSNPSAEWNPADATGNTTTYHVGRDKSRWAEDVPQYARLVRRNVYPGIDAAYYGADGRIEYDYLLEPGADPNRIRMRIHGAQSVTLNGAGDLVVRSAGGELLQHKPLIYQTAANGSRVIVSGGFRVQGNEVRFRIGPYDRSRPLAIDPVIDSSTYLGGSADDEIVYSNGTITAGNTKSTDFPDTVTPKRDGWKAFYRSGSYTLILGGSGDDRLTGFYPGGYYYVLAGYTSSRDFPTSSPTGNPPQSEYAGGATDGFLAFFGPSLSTGANNFVSYYGTPGDDRITAMTNAYGFAAFTGWTTDRGLKTGSTITGWGVPSQIQDGPGGGQDGFVVTFSFSSNYLFLDTLRYFGGSGDDRPQSITVANAISASGYFIAGETNSADLPGLTTASTAPSGSSDAFITRYLTSFGSPISILYGGSGADRATGISTAGNGVAVGLTGVTSSTDLPLKNAAQATYGGGDSDAFVALISGDLTQILNATYVGGSGADEATSASTDSAGGWFVGGWTASPDFPVSSNAVQGAYGGGPDDAFLLHYDADGNLEQSTFFGGSGSDRVLSVSSQVAFQALIAGTTTSPDLPLQNALQMDLHGPSDGFMASISTKLILAPRVAGSARLRASTYLTVPVSSPPLALTLDSSDASSVLLASTSSGPASASLSVNANVGSSGISYYVDCLANGASADISVNSPGFPTKIAHVDCVAPSFSIAVSGGGSLWGASVSFPVSLIAYTPDQQSGNFVFAKTDADLIQAQIVISDPSIAKPSAVTVALGSYQSTSLNAVILAPLSIGSTDVTVSADGVVPGPYNRLRFTVTRPFGPPASATIPGGFQLQYSLSTVYTPPPGVTITLTSADPDKLLISKDPTQMGTASATGPAQVYLQALVSEGQSALTFAVTGFDPVTIPVTFTTPQLVVSSPMISAPTLGVGEISSYSAGFNFPYRPNPGNAIRVTLTSSDPQILKTSPPFFDLTPNLLGGNFQLNALAPGPATLTLSSTIGSAPPSASPLKVSVIHRPLTLSDLIIGKDLMASTSVRLPVEVSPTASVTISSSDPTKALVLTTASPAGAPQSTVSASNGVVPFNVLALTDSGSVKITATVADFGSASSTITLVPSGIGWSGDVLSTDFYSPTVTASIVSYALDPATLAPIAAQSLRPGVSPAVTLSLDRPDVVTLAKNTVSVPGNAGLAPASIGDAKIALQQPAGFSTPISRQVLTVHVKRAAIQFSGTTVGISTQQKLNLGYGTPPAIFQTKTATLKSSDPAKLLLSADPSTLGSGTLTIPATSAFWVQALDNRGSVSVTASIDGFSDTSSLMTLTGTGIMLTVQSASYNNAGSGSITTDTGNYTTLQSGTTAIGLNLALVDPDTGAFNFGYIPVLNPGVDTVAVVQSSDPSVGVIEGSPVRLPSTANNQSSVDFRPVGLGDTQVSAIPLPGFSIVTKGQQGQNGRLTFHVTAPAFDLGTQAPLGKDLARQIGIGLAANVKSQTVNVPITITSGDPSKLLLSRDAATAGSASITLTLIAGQRSPANFYIQALDRQGSVPLLITAPGFADGSSSIPLTDTLFGLAWAGNSTPLRVVAQSGPMKSTISMGTTNTTGGMFVRPGASIALHIDSSDPSVLAIDTPDVVLTSGAYSGEFTMHGVAPGPATITLTPPSDYGLFTFTVNGVPGTGGSANVNVEAVKLTFYLPTQQIGKDMQAGANVSNELFPAQNLNLTYTVTSSDPTRLLVSASPTTPGSAQATVPSTTGGNPAGIYLQSLASSGTVTLTVSAPGAQSATGTVQLVSSAVVFNSATTLTFTANGPKQSVPVSLSPLNPNSSTPFCCEDPRAGFSPAVTVTSSDPSIASVTPGTLTFSTPAPGASSQQSIDIKPGKAGTAIISLGVLPGNDAPASGRQIVVNVR